MNRENDKHEYEQEMSEAMDEEAIKVTGGKKIKEEKKKSYKHTKIKKKVVREKQNKTTNKNKEKARYRRKP